MPGAQPRDRVMGDFVAEYAYPQQYQNTLLH